MKEQQQVFEADVEAKYKLEQDDDSERRLKVCFSYKDLILFTLIAGILHFTSSFACCARHHDLAIRHLTQFGVESPYPFQV